MKLIQRQDSYENETLISTSATENDIKSALLSIDFTKTFELVDEDGSQINTAMSEETSRYWLNLTEVSRRGKTLEYHIDGQVADLRDVIKAFCYFLNSDPKLDSEFTWTDSTALLNSNNMDLVRALEVKAQADNEYSAILNELEKTNPELAENLRKEHESNLKEQQMLDAADADFNAMMAEQEAIIAENEKEMARLNEIQKEYENAYNPSASTIHSRGMVNNKIVCPQCNEKGFVHTHKVSKKAGISGGKATAALLTAGISLFVAGLSRSEKITEAYCGNCESQWYF